MISDELQERVAAAWFESIPLQYRYLEGSKDTRGVCGDRFLSSAIILGAPPPSVVERFLRSIFGTMHLTKKQQAAITARQNCGHPGRKRDAPPALDRESRARPKPSPPPSLMTFGELDDATRPYQDLDRMMMLSAGKKVIHAISNFAIFPSISEACQKAVFKSGQMPGPPAQMSLSPRPP
jgi:hypothetical protein